MSTLYCPTAENTKGRKGFCFCKASNTLFSHHNNQAKTLYPNCLLKSLMWADENNGFEDYNPQHCSFRGVISSLVHNERRQLSLNKTAGQGSVHLSAVKDHP